MVLPRWRCEVPKLPDNLIYSCLQCRFHVTPQYLGVREIVASCYHPKAMTVNGGVPVEVEIEPGADDSFPAFCPLENA